MFEKTKYGRGRQYKAPGGANIREINSLALLHKRHSMCTNKIHQDS